MKTLVFPIVMYACDLWTPLKSDLKKIDRFELWCWRRMLRIPWTARRTNKSILEEVKPTTPLQVMILRQKLSYFGHIMRTNNDCMEKAIMLETCEGRRKRGRPCRRWLDDIREATEKSLHQLKDSTRNRIGWRRVIMEVTRSRTRLDGTS